MTNRILRTGRVILSCAMDCAMLLLSIAVSFFLYNYLLRINSGFLSVFRGSAPLVCVGCILSFALFGIYEDLWEYISLGSLLRLAFAAFVASGSAYVSMRVSVGYWVSPIIGVTIFYLFLTCTVGWRVLPVLWNVGRRTVFSSLVRGQTRVPLLIIGAGEAAAALIKDLQMEGLRCPYKIVGLIDDDTRKYHHTLRGIRVLGTITELLPLVRRYSVQEIIIAIPSASTRQRREIIAACAPTGCRVRMMQKVAETSNAAVNNLHNLNITDLLGRHEVTLMPEMISSYITDHVVLVTGGGGSIGSEICRRVMRFSPRKLIVFDLIENNAYILKRELSAAYPEMEDRFEIRIGSVQDEKRLNAVFDEFQPDVVFHAAAYKHVPLMEECPDLAVQNNVFGSYNTAMAAISHNVKRFVMISTDKAVNPTNIMGATKRITEMLIQSLNGRGTEFVSVRFGNVLDSNGSVVPIFRQQIEAGGPVTVMHREVVRYFMTISEAAQLVLQAGGMAKGGETFILDMGEPVRILDLATAMIEMAGLTPGEDIEIVYTGLRPGEKLFEELMDREEGAQKTAHDKIFVARPAAIDDAQREAMLESLHACIENGGDMRAELRRLLPTYRPQPQPEKLQAMPVADKLPQPGQVTIEQPRSMEKAEEAR